MIEKSEKNDIGGKCKNNICKNNILKNNIIKVLVLLCLTPPSYFFSKMWFFHRYSFPFCDNITVPYKAKKRAKSVICPTSMMLHTKIPLDWRHGPDIGVPVWDNSIDRKFVR